MNEKYERETESPAQSSPPVGHPAPETVAEQFEIAEGTAQLARVLEACLTELEAGRPPDRARLLAAHPHLAPQLEQALAGLEYIHQATGRTDESPVQLGYSTTGGSRSAWSFQYPALPGAAIPAASLRASSLYTTALTNNCG